MNRITCYLLDTIKNESEFEGSAESDLSLEEIPDEEDFDLDHSDLDQVSTSAGATEQIDHSYSESHGRAADSNPGVAEHVSVPTSKTSDNNNLNTSKDDLESRDSTKSKDEL